MNTKDILNQFYNAFSIGDQHRMLFHYHKDIIFEDPAFGKLEGQEVKAMWSMLLEQAKGGLSITHEILSTDNNSGIVSWEAKYNYGKKRRPVHNIITAHLELQNDKIIKHKDVFDLWKWSQQALGIPGLLLGWTPYMKGKIQSGARKSLFNYMERNS
ncbi:MAG: nuclear transport factor 2 family protein [Saprospiraceae bacterium]|nr:nuclear transport factor 2 family protein [Saprospiraceae bacterium]